jgi:hypothetical protein
MSGLFLYFPVSLLNIVQIFGSKKKYDAHDLSIASAGRLFSFLFFRAAA